jgi:hypothetical protein
VYLPIRGLISAQRVEQHLRTLVDPAHMSTHPA